MISWYECKSKQECIRVGCVPAAHWLYAGVCFSGGGGPGSDPPQFPPWVWAWIWSPSISPLGVGLDLIPLNFLLGYGPGSDPPSVSTLGVGLDLIPPSVSPLGVGLEGEGGVSLARGVSFAGGCLLGRGVSQHALRQTPPVNRMTDRCKNITLATTSLRPVTIHATKPAVPLTLTTSCGTKIP